MESWTHNYTGHPLVRHVRRLFASGEMGTVRKHIDGKPLNTDEYNFPTVYDGLRGMQFIYKALESSDKGAVWVDLPSSSALKNCTSRGYRPVSGFSRQHVVRKMRFSALGGFDFRILKLACLTTETRHLKPL